MENKRLEMYQANNEKRFNAEFSKKVMQNEKKIVTNNNTLNNKPIGPTNMKKPVNLVNLNPFKK